MSLHPFLQDDILKTLAKTEALSNSTVPNASAVTASTVPVPMPTLRPTLGARMGNNLSTEEVAPASAPGNDEHDAATTRDVEAWEPDALKNN